MVGKIRECSPDPRRRFVLPPEPRLRQSLSARVNGQRRFVEPGLVNPAARTTEYSAVFGYARCHSHAEKFYDFRTLRFFAVKTMKSVTIKKQTKAKKNHIPDDGLSTRQREILVLVAAGKVNKEIADVLGISVNTLVGYREILELKTRAKGAAALTCYAIARGYVKTVEINGAVTTEQLWKN